MNEKLKKSPDTPVPLLDLARQHADLKDEIIERLGEVVDNGQFILGPDVKRLESTIATYCQTSHALGCASGSDALLLALMACRVGKGDEVILPSFTFFATASAVTRLGATPVFADIDLATFTIAPTEVERLVTAKTKALLPVHLFGQCAEMDELMQLSKSLNLFVIEDAAQAIGAEFGDRRAGSMGHVGCFSFYPTKNLGGVGDGGMLTTSDEELADRLELLRGHGMRPRYYHREIGINSRLDSFQAAVLNIKMRYIDRYCRMRQEKANRYTQLFIEAGLNHVLGLPAIGDWRRHVWNQYVLRVPEGRRDALRQSLANARIDSEIYYPLGLHQQKCFAHLGYAPEALPQTVRATQEVLALPIFPELRTGEQERVVTQVATFFDAQRNNRQAAA